MNFKKFLSHVYPFIGLLILSILLGCCSLVLTAIPCDLYRVKILLTDGWVLIMNIGPIFLLMTILYFAFNRVWASFLVTGVLVFVVAEVNRFKIYFRDDPFVAKDLVLINEAKNMVGQYELFLDTVTVLSAIFIIVATIASIFMFKGRKFDWKVRCVGAVGVLLLLLVSVNVFYFKDTKIYAKTWHEEFGSNWKAANQTMSHGVIYSFIRSIPDAIPSPPEGYNKEEVEKILDGYQDADIPEEKKVHIISVMLEAYNDFSQFEGLEFVEDPYKNFHELQEDSYHGQLFTNIFAAGTIDTERAFLTGYSDTDIDAKITPSYVWYLKEQGYYTEAMHPCYGWFYDRINVNTNLGFDHFDYQENRYAYYDPTTLEGALYHNLLSDLDFFTYVTAGYRYALEDGKKYFNFSVTYQNHGPYDTTPITDKEYLMKKDEYTEEEYNIINNYLHGIAGTDLALKKLRDFADAQEEPLVLILFGDHNPWLGDENSVYNMLGIDIDLGTVEGAQNYYQTPYVFYANEAAKAALGKDFIGEGETISPMFLMSEYFRYVGLEGSAYMNYIQDIRDEYSVFNVAYVKKGDEYILNENTEILKELELVQYYMKNHKKME